MAGKPRQPDYACLFCDGKTIVLRATPNKREGVMRRKRKCRSCGREQFTIQPLSELTELQQQPFDAEMVSA